MLYLCYSTYRKRSRSDDGEKELINISSDDDLSKNGDEDASVQKLQNSVATAVEAKTQVSVHAKVSVLYIIYCQSGMGKVSRLCLQNGKFTLNIYVKNVLNSGHELGKLCDALCFLLNG